MIKFGLWRWEPKNSRWELISLMDGLERALSEYERLFKDWKVGDPLYLMAPNCAKKGDKK